MVPDVQLSISSIDECVLVICICQFSFILWNRWGDSMEKFVTKRRKTVDIAAALPDDVSFCGGRALALLS